MCSGLERPSVASNHKKPNMHSDTKAYTHWVFVFDQYASFDAL